ncbi:uncharacterized protein CELE_T07H3.7 [Caenorhabditis elegans]|uniref:Secreted protein n=1 Tax=Caenorhabditis elegans TaxID=6239 RepID=Q4W4Y9_CAEEL|nr:Secreted protein [Caenorhabditis elegans]CCD63702.1 Secreted protein [Caenorhabditis elegans]|eukprot:NP_001022325.1 Uncharacterized protein CELE_T07H3.7 [Caenorhabditis elegans]
MKSLSVFTFIIFLTTLAETCMRTIPPDEVYITSTLPPEQDTTPGSPGTSATDATPTDSPVTQPTEPSTVTDPVTEPVTTPMAPLTPCQMCDGDSLTQDLGDPAKRPPTSWR